MVKGKIVKHGKSANQTNNFELSIWSYSIVNFQWSIVNGFNYGALPISTSDLLSKPQLILGRFG